MKASLLSSKKEKLKIKKIKYYSLLYNFFTLARPLEI